VLIGAYLSKLQELQVSTSEGLFCCRILELLSSYVVWYVSNSQSSEATRSRAFENEAMAMDRNSTALIVTDIFSKPSPLHCEEDTSTSCVDFVAVWRRLRLNSPQRSEFIGVFIIWLDRLLDCSGLMFWMFQYNTRKFLSWWHCLDFGWPLRVIDIRHRRVIRPLLLLTLAGCMHPPIYHPSTKDLLPLLCDTGNRW